MLSNIRQKRFEFFFLTQLLILFSSIIIPFGIYEAVFSPLFFILNIAAGVFIVSKNHFLSPLIKVIIGILLFEFLYTTVSDIESNWNLYIRFFGYAVFYTMVSFELIKQVWRSVDINSSVIFGLMSGYISIGLIGFFLFFLIDIFNPEAYSGIMDNDLSAYQSRASQILYFSFITLLTIGYGEITPVIPIAQKAAVFIGLIGQLYLVVITSIVVGKYLNQNHINKKQ